MTEVEDVAGTVWVSATSHRSREKLRRIAGDLPSYGVWPKGDWPRGDYYQVPEQHAEELRRVKGLRVLKGRPQGGEVFKRWTSAATGGPERGNWPVPTS